MLQLGTVALEANPQDPTGGVASIELITPSGPAHKGLLGWFQALPVNPSGSVLKTQVARAVLL